jgi:hypothetical protein
LHKDKVAEALQKVAEADQRLQELEEGKTEAPIEVKITNSAGEPPKSEAQ